ncbi:exodeoxyribonuclease III [Enterovirga rhinocerotis]|uniref:Exodeoxyribonuclease-3 n=1 Tax=Enterovirga rhinocerotis TaxID=1339210 RepID=A0A4R7BJ86_9HYPH|nr:exodeoxyribonuclease III [Enterovirga rhinocerotis]TDR85318.1 exodeoxyribonuclease-3 [Enterovirga rhinocerotis]
MVRATRTSRPKHDTLKLATFNVNDVVKRLPNVVRWLVDREPDIVCLQELKCENVRFPDEAFRDIGYSSVWNGQRTWNGVAILSKGSEPVLTRTALPGDPDDVQARYVEAAAKGILVASIYLPNGNPAPGPKFDYKIQWFERLIGHATTLQREGVPVVLAGDFNVVPTDADIYPTTSFDGNALLRPESREAFSRVLGGGWTDAIRFLHPSEPMFTFWSYLRNRWARDAGLRLDHLLLNDIIRPRLMEAGVDRNVRGETAASDHAPAWIILRRE